jgi:hypothetical protein
MWVLTMEFMWEPTMHSVSLYGLGGLWCHFFHGKEGFKTLDDLGILNFVVRGDAKKKKKKKSWRWVQVCF